MKNSNKPIIPTQEQKQETIEEASKKFIDLWFLTGQGTTEVFIAGAEWQKHQSEKMFSNEEVIELFTNWNNEEYGNDGWEIILFLKWFDKHKKH